MSLIDQTFVYYESGCVGCGYGDPLLVRASRVHVPYDLLFSSSLERVGSLY